MLAKVFRASEMLPTSYTGCPNYEHTITIAAGGEGYDVRTLQDRNEHLVKAVYHFFQSVCASPSFTLSDWFYLYHSGSIDDLWN
jgi:hypothetical protein